MPIAADPPMHGGAGEGKLCRDGLTSSSRLAAMARMLTTIDPEMATFTVSMLVLNIDTVWLFQCAKA